MTAGKFEPIVAVGVMSGTSLDGIDIVRVVTDGEDVCRVEGHYYREYSAHLRSALAVLVRGDMALNDVLRIERELSEAYAEALVASKLLGGAAVVGCHGQTIRHLPEEGLTWQLGDMNFVAEKIGVPVVGDYRRRDMAAGVEGAPLAPLFHAMMLRAAGVKAGAVLNIGGVANVTVMAADGTIRASDCGPGMGLLNSWIKQQTGEEFDRDGELSLSGQADEGVVSEFLAEGAFWKRPLPRSADRYDFEGVLPRLSGMNVENGAATLALLTAEGIALTLRALEGQGPVYAAGGGVRNLAILKGLQSHSLDVKPVKELGMSEDAVEAGCWAWLAVRRLRGLTTSLPTTTRCSHPTVGGVVTA